MRRKRIFPMVTREGHGHLVFYVLFFLVLLITGNGSLKTEWVKVMSTARKIAIQQVYAPLGRRLPQEVAEVRILALPHSVLRESFCSLQMKRIGGGGAIGNSPLRCTYAEITGSNPIPTCTLHSSLQCFKQRDVVADSEPHGGKCNIVCYPFNLLRTRC